MFVLLIIDLWRGIRINLLLEIIKSFMFFWMFIIVGESLFGMELFILKDIIYYIICWKLKLY